jgi:hypothetical protein
MVINRKTSRKAVFGRDEYGGLGIDHMAVVQGIGQIQNFIGTLHNEDIIGHLFRSLMEFTQMECGIEQQLIMPYYKKYKYTMMPD